jgi:hypothetical protein
MGKYISQSDIEDVFGTENVKVWSNLNNDAETADTVRIARAIDFAEEEIENRFRDGQYAIPFSGTSGTPKVLVDWIAKLAGMWLYESRPQKFTTEDEESEQINFGRMKKQMEKDINAYTSGQRRMALVLAESDSPTAPATI